MSEIIICENCEIILKENEIYHCEICARNLCDECWGTISHETIPAVMFPRDGSAPSPAERDKTMCDGCYEVAVDER